MVSVLTVDDEAHIHKGLDAIIDWSSLGCSHDYTAENGVKALSIIKKKRPGIILTDIKMPVMDGIELIREIRKIDEYNPAIIIMSGYNDFEYAQAALRHDVSDYLLKPVDEEELSACILKVLSRKNSFETVQSGDTHRSAAVSTIFRRLCLKEVSGTKEELALVLKGHALQPPYAFALICRFSDSPAGSGDIFFERLQNILASFKEKVAPECMYRDNSDSIGILLSGRLVNNAHTNVKLAVNGFYNELVSALGVPLKLVVGVTVDYISMISESRRSVFDFISGNYVMFSPGAVIVEHEYSRMPSAVSREGLESIMRLIDRNDEAGVKEEVYSFFRGAGSTGVSADTLREWLHLLLHEVQHLIYRLGGKELPSGGRILQLLKHIELTPASIIESVIIEYLSSACREVAELRLSVRHSNVLLIKRAIERRCTEELTLGELARELDMNPVYLGQMFKQVIGKSFKDFQREIRIKEACRLLRETNTRISEIASAVGYNNYDYFVEQFKRECGVTPSFYRRK